MNGFNHGNGPLPMPPQRKEMQVQRNHKTHAAFKVLLNFKGLQPVMVADAVIDVEDNVLLIGPYKWHLTPDRKNKDVQVPPELSTSGIVGPNGVPVAIPKPTEAQASDVPEDDKPIPQKEGE